MKVTLCPMKTSSSIWTPSQMKVWLEILQFSPTLAFFWISTKAPILVLAPIEQPYRLMNLDSLTPSPSLTSGAIERNWSAAWPCFALIEIRIVNAAEYFRLEFHQFTALFQ